MRVSINIATHEARKDVLPKAIRSLHNQTVEPSVIRVYCNDYKPDLSLEEEFDKLELYHSTQDYTDRAKFLWVNEEELYFTFDDDIFAPPTYIERTVNALEKYPQAIVTYHGRKLQGKGLHYYSGHQTYHFLRNVHSDTMIDVPGTGVTAFNTKHFQPDILQYEEDCMADVLLALEAAKKGVKTICLQHEMGWLKSLTGNEGSIYIQERNSCDRQSELADVIYSIKNDI